MESPLDPDDDLATYRVACPQCNVAVWASHSPPPEEGESLLDGHDCPGPVEAQVEPGSNGADGVTMGGPPAEDAAPELAAYDAPDGAPLAIDTGARADPPA